MQRFRRAYRSVCAPTTRARQGGPQFKTALVCVCAQAGPGHKRELALVLDDLSVKGEVFVDAASGITVGTLGGVLCCLPAPPCIPCSFRHASDTVLALRILCRGCRLRLLGWACNCCERNQEETPTHQHLRDLPHRFNPLRLRHVIEGSHSKRHCQTDRPLLALQRSAQPRRLVPLPDVCLIVPV